MGGLLKQINATLTMKKMLEGKPPHMRAFSFVGGLVVWLVTLSCSKDAANDFIFPTSVLQPAAMVVSLATA
jgi:hypothetical protein